MGIASLRRTLLLKDLDKSDDVPACLVQREQGVRVGAPRVSQVDCYLNGMSLHGTDRDRHPWGLEAPRLGVSLGVGRIFPVEGGHVTAQEPIDDSYAFS